VGIVFSDVWLAQSVRWLAQSVAPRVFGLDQEWPLFGQLVHFLAFFALVPAMVFVLMRTVRWLRPVYMKIRQDWTQLSFGLSVASAFMLSGIDHEEDPD
jgi:hypothetical protein